MINLTDYLNPVSLEREPEVNIPGQSQFTRNLTVNTENNPVKSVKGFRVAIIGVPDDRTAPVAGSSGAPDAIRRVLYTMARIPGKLKIVDAGNLKPGAGPGDTIAGLTDVLNHFSSHNIVTIILGGTSSLFQAVNRYFQEAGTSFSLVTIDSRIDYQPENRDGGYFNSLSPFFTSTGNNMSHFVNLAYQTYLNDPQVITRLTRKHHDLLRLGDVRQAIHLTEPFLRDSDAVLFDIGAVRQADAPGSGHPSPNGLYAEEACLLARYTGVSDKLRFFGLFEVNPALDKTGQTASLAAQIAWFLIESFSQKQSENPAECDATAGRFTRYHINVDDTGTEMIFVKSNFTERWWIELNTAGNKKVYVACSYEDYLKANSNEMPERWIRSAARFRAG